jgi:probable HAF family extracellular repeat protein
MMQAKSWDPTLAIRGIGPGHGFILAGRDFTLIDVPESFATGLNGINNSGQIVGIYSSGGPAQGFLLSQGTYTTLSVPGSTQTYATGINNLGQIVGYYGDSVQGHGFLYEDGSYITIDVPTSLGRDSVLNGINDLGQIVGSYTGADGYSHGFLAAPVPEPSTFFLLGIGTLGVVGWAWRRQLAGNVKLKSKDESKEAAGGADPAADEITYARHGLDER